MTPYRQVTSIDLGSIGYTEAWQYQTRLFEDTLATKMANRARPAHEQQPTSNYLLFCEHPPVYTLGKSGKREHLLASAEDLARLNATFVHVNRGGDITFHGPGQLVVYPVLDLENFFTDIHRYMRQLEEAVLQTLRTYAIVAGRLPGFTGVWLPEPDRKICAMGVKTSRWVTMHGLALNVNTDLRYFDYIVPCGIKGKAVTSLAQELNHPVPLPEVKARLELELVRAFGMEISVTSTTEGV